MNGLVCALLLAAAAGMAQDVAPEVPTLERIKKHVKANLARIPDYTCLQTIDRQERRPNSIGFQPVDQVRLDVARIGNREVYSWPGEDAFEARSVAELAGGGTFSCGEFTQHLSQIFLSAATLITWRGEESAGGGRVLRYDYQVPLRASGWILQIGSHAGRVASQGSFWADAETLDVLRLTVDATDIPRDLPVRRVALAIGYGRVRIGASEVWLPRTTDLLMKYATGLQVQNQTTFTHCRQYLGSSKISFGDPGEATPAASAGPRRTRVEIPAGVVLEMSLETEIRSDGAWVGAPVIARLDRDLRAGRAVLFPKGSTIKARLRGIARSERPAPHAVVILSFSSIESEDHEAHLLASLQGASGQVNVDVSLAELLRRPVDLVEESEVRASIPPGTGSLFVRGRNFVLAPKLHMVWKTISR